MMNEENNRFLSSSSSSSSSSTLISNTTSSLSSSVSPTLMSGDSKEKKLKYIETRLYDVVNVLNSIGIIEKCNAKKQRGQSLGIRFTGTHTVNIISNDLYYNESNHINVRIKHSITMSPINNGSNSGITLISPIQQQQQQNMPEKKRRKVFFI